MKNFINIKIASCLTVFLVVAGVHFNLSSLVFAANFTAPEWWGNINPASCDPAHFGGSSSLEQWSGISSCAPQGTQNPVQFIRGGAGFGNAQLEWQCVEMVMRYMMTAWGAKPYAANGSQVVGYLSNGAVVGGWNASGNTQSIPGITPIEITANNTNGQVPSIGDVISFGNYNDSNGGHTAIITDVRQLSGSGNYAFTFFDQNDSTNPYHTNQLTMSNWIFSITGLYTTVVNGWLHQQAIGSNTPGNMTGYIAGINPPSGDKQIFTIDTKGQIVTSWQCSGTNCPGGWANWQEVSPSTTRFPTTAHLSAVMDQANLIEVFGTDANGVFWHMWGQQGSWSSLYQVGAGALGASDITAANWDSNGDMVIWMTYIDNNPYYMTSLNGSWSVWNKYSNAQFPLGTRYIMGRDSGFLNLVALGGDGKIYSNWTPWGQNNWQGAFSLFANNNNGQFSADPSITLEDSSLNQTILAPITNGSVWLNYESSRIFQGWMQLSNSPYIRNTIAATQTKTTNPELYTRDVNYNIWHNWVTGCGSCYSGWNLFSASIPFSSDPNAISDSSNYPEIFVTGTDGKTYHQWLNSNGWSGWQLLSNGYTG